MTEGDPEVDLLPDAGLMVPLPDDDWLRTEEAESVLATIAAKDAAREQRLKAAFEAPAKTADEALAELQPAVAAFIERAAGMADQRLSAKMARVTTRTGFAPRPPAGEQALASAGLGVGKTAVTLGGVGAFLAQPTPGRQAPRRAVYNIPDHALAEDVAKRFAAMFPNVPCQVHRGIERADPDAPGFADPSVPADRKIPMCRRLADAKAVIDAGGNITTLCGSRARGYCPHHPKNPAARPRDVCGRQRARTIKAGMLFLAGPTALTQAPPESFRRTIEVKVKSDDWHGGAEEKRKRLTLPTADILIADEPKFLGMLGGCADRPYDISLDRLTAPVRRFPGDEETGDDAANAATVVDTLTRFKETAETLPPGPPTAGDLRHIVGLADWGVVRRSALAFKADPERFIKPSTPAKELHETLGRLRAHNGRLFRIARMAHALEDATAALHGRPDDAESGRIELVDDDEGGRALRLRWLEPVAEAWRGTPTLLLDGTPDIEIARKWFPNLQVIADARAATPTCVERVQVHDRAFSYLAWSPRGAEPPPDDDQSPAGRRERTAWNNVARLGRLLSVRCARYRGQGRDGVDVLAVMPKRTEEALEHWFARHGGKPAGLATLHFQKLRGQDSYGGVRALVLVSRPQPSAGELERLAWTLTGVRGTRAPDGALPKAEAFYRMRDGSTPKAVTARHPDEWAERVRVALCDNEVLQGEARPRSVRRTPDRPLSVEILTSVPVPLEIDALVEAETIVADAHPARWLVAAGVVPVLSSKGSRALLGALLGTSPKAVGHMLDRDPTWAAVFGASAQTPQTPYRESPMANGVSEVFEVRLTSAARYATKVLIRAASPADAEARLRSLGVIAAQVGEAGPPDPQAPPPVVRPLPPDPEPASAELDTGGDLPPAWAREVIPVDAYAVATMDADPDDFDPWPRFQPSSHPPWMSAGWAGPAAHIAR